MLGGGRRGRRGRELRREPGAADVGGGARPAPPRPRRAGRSRGAGGLRRRRPRRRRPGRARAASPARGGERRDVRAWILLQGDDGNCTDVDDNQDYTAAADLEPICNVTGAADCRAECERMERCGAWTWGKVRGSLGLTDCCFPKVVGRSGKVRREANENVVSGFACRGGNAARYGELLSEAAPDVPTTAAYTEAGLELPKLTNGDFSTNDDGDYNRVDLNVSDSLVFDLGGDYDVTSISIAGGNAHLGGTETPKTIDIYTASSLDGPWVQSETLQYPTIVDNIDAAINAQRKDLPLELLRTRFVKLHFLDNHGNEHVAVRQVAFGGVESVNESVSEFVSTTTEVAEHHEPLTTTTDAAELNAPVTTTSAGIAPSSEDEVSAASLFDDVFRSFDDDEARDERDQAATAAGLSRHRRHPAAAGSGTADTTTAATLTGVPTADSATDLSTTTAADAVAAAPEPQGAAYAAGRPGRGSLYCFALMMPDTYEEALLLWQVRRGDALTSGRLRRTGPPRRRGPERGRGVPQQLPLRHARARRGALACRGGHLGRGPAGVRGALRGAVQRLVPVGRGHVPRPVPAAAQRHARRRLRPPARGPLRPPGGLAGLRQRERGGLPPLQERLGVQDVLRSRARGGRRRRGHAPEQGRPRRRRPPADEPV
ncbi:unnamed protein product [Prorocentrum cordatum]|uniref:F5/8 type C domain-containing protein n=1 Tax=Prorocentrum cordatum TaxID=2364126 RepID=A0ABN9W195_9DINO|nr:unnamed protein product [Polarella glacialis]